LTRFLRAKRSGIRALIHKHERPADVSFGAHNGLKSDIASGPKSANNGSGPFEKEEGEAVVPCATLHMSHTVYMTDHVEMNRRNWDQRAAIHYFGKLTLMTAVVSDSSRMAFSAPA
jgi:hypothetical protein